MSCRRAELGRKAPSEVGKIVAVTSAAAGDQTNANEQTSLNRGDVTITSCDTAP